MVVAIEGDWYGVGHPEDVKSRTNLGPLAGEIRNRKYFYPPFLF